MKIGIISAGIGGLAAAALLADRDHAVRALERFAIPRPIGSGLVIQPLGPAVPDRIGVGAQARSLGTPLTAMLGHAGFRAVRDVAYHPDAPGPGIHRGALFHILWQAVRDRQIPVITDAWGRAAPLHGPQRLIETETDTHGPYDLIIDASGASSALSPQRARPVGFGAIWGRVPRPADTPLRPDRLTQRYHRASRKAGILPIGRLPDSDTPLAALFWSLPADQLNPWPNSDFDGWRATARSFWPDLAPVLDALPGLHAMSAARYSHGTLRRPYAPALAFIGDAAHRASPQLGQVANMTLPDAMALTTEAPLPRYARMRRGHLRSYQAMSALLTPMYQYDRRTLPSLRDHLLARLGRLPPVRAAPTRPVSGDLLPPLASSIFPSSASFPPQPVP